MATTPGQFEAKAGGSSAPVNPFSERVESEESANRLFSEMQRALLAALPTESELATASSASAASSPSAAEADSGASGNASTASAAQTGLRSRSSNPVVVRAINNEEFDPATERQASADEAAYLAMQRQQLDAANAPIDRAAAAFADAVLAEIANSGFVSSSNSNSSRELRTKQPIGALIDDAGDAEREPAVSAVSSIPADFALAESRLHTQQQTSERVAMDDESDASADPRSLAAQLSLQPPTGTRNNYSSGGNSSSNAFRLGLESKDSLSLSSVFAPSTIAMDTSGLTESSASGSNSSISSGSVQIGNLPFPVPKAFVPYILPQHASQSESSPADTRAGVVRGASEQYGFLPLERIEDVIAVPHTTAGVDAPLEALLS